MKSVELCHAFSWVCPVCCHRQYERSIVVEMTDEERDQVRREHGLGMSGCVEQDVLVAPREVTCDKCGDRFLTLDPGTDRFDCQY